MAFVKMGVKGRNSNSKHTNKKRNIGDIFLMLFTSKFPWQLRGFPTKITSDMVLTLESIIVVSKTLLVSIHVVLSGNVGSDHE